MRGSRRFQARSALVGAARMLAALACTLSSIDPPTATAPLTVQVILTPTAPVTPAFVIQTPTPTATNVALPNPTQAPPTVINCFPQTGWPVYVVVPGDT